MIADGRACCPAKAGGLPRGCRDAALPGTKLLNAAARIYAPHVRDLEAIDSELRLLLAIRHMAREAEGRTPNTARIDALLEERSKTVSAQA